MRIPIVDADLAFDRARRRLVAALAGVVTGSAVALTLVQFNAARQKRLRQDD